jgi:hypothetical protein
LPTNAPGCYQDKNDQYYINNDVPFICTQDFENKEYVMEIMKINNITTPVRPDILLIVAMSTSKAIRESAKAWGEKTRRKGHVLEWSGCQAYTHLPLCETPYRNRPRVGVQHLKTGEEKELRTTIGRWKEGSI